VLSASWSSSPLSVGSLDDDDDDEEEVALFKDDAEEEEEEEDEDEEGLGGVVFFSLSLELASGERPLGVGLLNSVSNPFVLSNSSSLS
jgi:hypothetical protein